MYTNTEQMFSIFGRIESATALKKSGMIVFDSAVAAANASHAVKAGLVPQAVAHCVTVEWVLPKEEEVMCVCMYVCMYVCM